MKKATCWWFGRAAVAALTVGMAGCANGSQANEEESDEPSHAEESGEHAQAEGGAEHAMAEGAGEHAMAGHGGEHGEGGEGDEHGKGGEEGEESGVYIGAAETWDVVRGGARLVLAFDPESNAFVGTVENTTRETLCAVRVEVHLSTGTELGPTERTDVRAGQSTAVRLPTEGEAFDTWTAHAELSACSGG